MARNSQTAPSGCVVPNCIDQPYQDGYCYFHLRKLHPEAIGGAKPATKPVAPNPTRATARGAERGRQMRRGEIPGSATSRTPVVIDTKPPTRKPAPVVTRATRTSTPTTDLTELQRIERAGGRLTERQKRALRKAAREAQSNAKSPARGVVATQRSVAGKGATSSKPVVRTGKTTPPIDKVHAEQKRTRTRQAPSFYADKALQPATPEAKGLLAGPALTSALRWVSIAGGKDAARPALCTVNVETRSGQLEIVATDGHRLHVVHQPCGKYKLPPNKPVALGPNSAHKAMWHQFNAAIPVVKESIKSPLGSFESWVASVPHTEPMSYPDWHRLIEPNHDFREDEFVIEVGLTSLRDALKPIVAFVKAAKAATTSPVVLSWIKAKVGTSLHLSANVTDLGDVESDVVVNIVSGAPIKYIAVNAVYLADVIARMPSDTVTLKITTAMAPLYARVAEGVVEYEALLMPVRIGADYELPPNVTGVAKPTVKMTRKPKVEPAKVDGKAEMAAAEKRLTPEVKDDATAATKPARRSVRTRSEPTTVKPATRGRRVPASGVQRAVDQPDNSGDRGSVVARPARARKDNGPDDTASAAAPPESGTVERKSGRQTVDRGTAGVTRLGAASQKSAVTNLVKGWASQYEAKVDDKPTPTMRKRAETQITELVAAGHKVSDIVQAISLLFAQNRAIADLPKLIKEVA